MEIKRDIYLDRLIRREKNGLIKIVTGVRLCGKSYLLNVLFRQHLIDEGIKERDIIMMALDEDTNIRYRNPLELGKFIREQCADQSRFFYVLNNIQNTV